MLPVWFVYIGTILSLIGGSKYFWDTLKGSTKPNRVTFFFWTIGPLMSFAGQLQKGVGLQSLLTFIVGFVPLMILLASFMNKKAYWRLTRFDYICGVIATIGLIGWQVSKDPDIAIVFGVLTDFVAAIPTLVKSYKDPESETALTYMLASINGLIVTLTITTWNFQTALWPVYIFLINLTLILIIHTRKKQLASRKVSR